MRQGFVNREYRCASKRWLLLVEQKAEQDVYATLDGGWPGGGGGLKCVFFCSAISGACIKKISLMVGSLSSQCSRSLILFHKSYLRPILHRLKIPWVNCTCLKSHTKMPEPNTIPLTVAHTKYIVCVEGYPLSDININCYFAGIKGLSVKDSVVSRLLKTSQCIGLGLVNFFYMEG